VETCKRLGVKLKLAGAGVRHVDGNRIYCSDGEVYEGEYVGFVNHEERVKLYQGAIATFTPTIYVEPFNMTVIEAQMCGTPVIATDWGSFPEIIEHGKTGFRCHTLNEFEHAARLAPTLDNDYIRKQTVQRYSIDNIKWKYETYFRRLQDLWGDGWYASHDLDKHWSEPWL
jgi:glycosyltransferase involved in cell wall biosynthesis